MTLFLSYSSKDKALVQGVRMDLARAHLEVWLDQELRGGDSWWQEVLRQIRECDAFLFALSANSLMSKPCRAELAYARALGLPILPVQIGPVENLRATPVADIQVVDYRERNADSGIALVSGISDAVGSRRPLPDPLPEPPPVPFAYLLRLGEAMDAAVLSPDRQGQLLYELRECLETEDDEGVREDARGLLRALRRRTDVTHRSVMEIDVLLTEPVRVTTAGREESSADRAEQARRAVADPVQPPPSSPNQAGPADIGPRQDARPFVVPPQPFPQAFGTPPGWYPDPSGSGAQRYWDGAGWSSHVRAPEQSSSTVLSIIGIVCGAIGFLFFPVGVAGVVCAMIAKSRQEKLSTVSLGISIGGTAIGIIVFLSVSASMY
jgi:hypothetical protein